MFFRKLDIQFVIYACNPIFFQTCVGDKQVGSILKYIISYFSCMWMLQHLLLYSSLVETSTEVCQTCCQEIVTGLVPISYSVYFYVAMIFTNIKFLRM